MAKQRSVEDALDMIIESSTARASEIERDELVAEASSMAALAARGGN